MKRKLNEAHELLATHLTELGLKFEREFKFAADRRWRSDFYLPDHGVLIEIHGSVYTSGHHTRGKGFEDDREKMNTAQILGFRALEFSTGQVKNGTALEWLRANL